MEGISQSVSVFDPDGNISFLSSSIRYLHCKFNVSEDIKTRKPASSQKPLNITTAKVIVNQIKKITYVTQYQHFTIFTQLPIWKVFPKEQVLSSSQDLFCILVSYVKKPAIHSVCNVTPLSVCLPLTTSLKTFNKEVAISKTLSCQKFLPISACAETDQRWSVSALRENPSMLIHKTAQNLQVK